MSLNNMSVVGLYIQTVVYMRLKYNMVDRNIGLHTITATDNTKECQ